MKRGKKKAWFYSMPFLIIVGLMIVVPLLYTVEISFTNMSIYHWKDYHCVGLDNYKKALLAFDSGFLPAFLRTLLWTVSSMALQLIFGFFIAVGLNAKGLKLRRVYKTLLIVPWAMPAYVSILLWRMGIFNTEFGLFNQILKQIGGKTVNFLSTNGMAFISCLVVNLWLGVPYMFTMMDGAMQSIDRNIYESAELDGAGFWKKHFYVTIPQILPILMPVIIMATFTAFKQFDIVYLMTMQTGSKTGADINTVITYVYEKAFITSNYGYSSAVALNIGFILLSFLTLIPILYAFSISISGSNSIISTEFHILPKTITMDNYITILTERPFGRWFVNSLLLSALTVLLTMLVAVPAAYVFSRMRFVGRKRTLYILLVLNAFPAILSMFAIYRIIKTLNLLNSYMGLVFIYAGSMAIFVFWNMKGYFDSIPEAIEDAARIDGVNDRQLITKIVMPLARPSIIISSVLVVIYVWNEYIFSTVFLSGAEKNTLAVALYSLQATDYTRNWPLFSAAAILTTLPVLILFFLVQKYMVSGLSSGGVKG